LIDEMPDEVKQAVELLMTIADRFPADPPELPAPPAEKEIKVSI